MNLDFGLVRDFRLREQRTVQFRAEMTNALNLVNLSNPITNSSVFGTIREAGAMRQVQFGRPERSVVSDTGLRADQTPGV